MADRARGWAPLAARLAESTGWDPAQRFLTADGAWAELDLAIRVRLIR